MSQLLKKRAALIFVLRGYPTSQTRPYERDRHTFCKKFATVAGLLAMTR